MQSTTKPYSLNGTAFHLANTGGAQHQSGIRPVGASVGAAPAIFSTMPVFEEPGVEPRDPRKCSGNDNTCGAWKAKGTEFCTGHNRSLVDVVSAGVEAGSTPWFDGIDD